MNDILDDQQLKKIFGCDQGKKLIELMQKQGVRYLVTREGKPFTTMAAVNDVLLGSVNDQANIASFRSPR